MSKTETPNSGLKISVTKRDIQDGDTSEQILYVSEVMERVTTSHCSQLKINVAPETQENIPENGSYGLFTIARYRKKRNLKQPMKDILSS